MKRLQEAALYPDDKEPSRKRSTNPLKRNATSAHFSRVHSLSLVRLRRRIVHPASTAPTKGSWLVDGSFEQHLGSLGSSLKKFTPCISGRAQNLKVVKQLLACCLIPGETRRSDAREAWRHPLSATTKEGLCHHSASCGTQEKSGDPK